LQRMGDQAAGLLVHLSVSNRDAVEALWQPAISCLVRRVCMLEHAKRPLSMATNARLLHSLLTSPGPDGDDDDDGKHPKSTCGHARAHACEAPGPVGKLMTASLMLAFGMPTFRFRCHTPCGSAEHGDRKVGETCKALLRLVGETAASAPG